MSAITSANSNDDDPGINRRAMLRSQLSMMPKSSGDRTKYNMMKTVGLAPRNADIPSNVDDKKNKSNIPSSKNPVGDGGGSTAGDLFIPTNTAQRRAKTSSNLSINGFGDNRELDTTTPIRTASRRFPFGSSKQLSNADVAFGGIQSNTDIRAKSKKYVQVRFESTKVNEGRRSSCLRVLGCSDSRISIYESTYDGDEGDSFRICGLSANQIITSFLHFVFRNSFLTFILVASGIFLTVNFLFAGIIYAIGTRYPHCIGGVEYIEDQFVDAFLLSWNTFSSVGYGMIYPGLSSTEYDVRDCTGLTAVLAYEAFCGVLFGSICCAILFIKVGRVQSFAQVVFSDPILIRYGSGVNVDDDEKQAEIDRQVELGLMDKTDSSPGTIRCPVLEFRIVNRLNNVGGGEITDCTANLVASIDASQAAGLAIASSRRRRRGRKRAPRVLAAVKRTEETADNVVDDGKEATDLNKAALVKLGITGPKRIRTSAKRLFAKIETESADHPYFKRVWLIRHVLNEESPLLNRHARGMIQRNKGSWPVELNNPAGIRAAVQFDTLVVSFSGTSSADGNSVYAQHVYDYGDVSVGYSFCNMLYRDTDTDSLFIDMSLINVVMEQNGGGGEPLDDAIPKIGSIEKKFRMISL